MEAMPVLIHSPSVGPSTWTPVAELLPRACVPDLRQAVAGGPPYPEQIAEAVRDQTPEGPLVLVAHSNAGLFVPVISQAVEVVACLFVDAHLPPAAGVAPVVQPAFLPFLRELADADGLLPRWTDWWPEEQVAPMFPDPVTRERVSAEQPRLPLAYFEQRVPVPPGWDGVPCAFLWYGPPYDTVAEEAARRGWPVTRLPGLHLHQLIDPESVAGHEFFTAHAGGEPEQSQT